MAINPDSLKPGDLIKVTLFTEGPHFYMVYEETDTKLNWLLLSTGSGVPRCVNCNGTKSNWIIDTSKHEGTEVVGNIANNLYQLQEELRELHK